MQMTRQRQYASVESATYEPCEYCSGRGLVKSLTTVSGEIQRRLEEIMIRNQSKRIPIRVTVHPRILQRLKEQDARFLEEMEKRYGGQLLFRADDSIHQEDFYFANHKTGDEL